MNINDAIQHLIKNPHEIHICGVETLIQKYSEQENPGTLHNSVLKERTTEFHIGENYCSTVETDYELKEKSYCHESQSYMDDEPLLIRSKSIKHNDVSYINFFKDIVGGDRAFISAGSRDDNNIPNELAEFQETLLTKAVENHIGHSLQVADIEEYKADRIQNYQQGEDDYDDDEFERIQMEELGAEELFNRQLYRRLDQCSKNIIVNESNLDDEEKAHYSSDTIDIPNIEMTFFSIEERIENGELNLSDEAQLAESMTQQSKYKAHFITYALPECILEDVLSRKEHSYMELEAQALIATNKMLLKSNRPEALLEHLSSLPPERQNRVMMAYNTESNASIQRYEERTLKGQSIKASEPSPI
ncbi:hypothetical protein AB6D11_19195 [Vibrio splendidus]